MNQPTSPTLAPTKKKSVRVDEGPQQPSRQLNKSPSFDPLRELIRTADAKKNLSKTPQSPEEARAGNGDGKKKIKKKGSDDEDVEQEGMLPAMKTNETLHNNYITATERYTRPPYRYTEASLVKQLEELGIGRPSTYAPTISTIQNRNYVEKGTVDGVERAYKQLVLEANKVEEKDLVERVGSDKGKLVPTDIGMIVTDFLVNHFESILD